MAKRGREEACSRGCARFITMPRHETANLLSRCEGLCAQAKGDLEQFSLYLEASVAGAVKLNSDLRYTEAYEVYKIGRNRWGEEPQVKALAGLFNK
jgi:hypothetical protein